MNVKVLIVSIFVFSLSAHGDRDSGGGHSVKLKSGTPLILLDLALHNPQIEDPQVMSPKIDFKSSRKVGGFRKVKAQNLDIYDVLKLKISSWDRFLPSVSSFLSKAIDEMDIFVTDGHLPTDKSLEVDLASLKTSFPHSKIWKGINYSRRTGAILSEKIWNISGDLSRMGYVIHEAVRHLQIYYHDSVGDAQLFRLTALLTLEEPSAESSTQLIPLLPTQLKEEIEIEGEFDRSLRELCFAVATLKFESDAVRTVNEACRATGDKVDLGQVVANRVNAITIQMAFESPQDPFRKDSEKLLHNLNNSIEKLIGHQMQQWGGSFNSILKDGNPFFENKSLSDYFAFLKSTQAINKLGKDISTYPTTP